MYTSWKRFLSLMLLAVTVFCSACDNSEFREQIGEFQKAMTDSRSAVEVYYQEMNQFEKDLYLLRREVDPNKGLGIVYAYKRPGPGPVVVDALYVNGPFAPASIQARLDSLKLINQYGSRLAELAGSDSPAKFSSGTAALGENIVKLGGTFSRLSGGRDTTAAEYIGPVSRLVGIVSALYLENKRDKALIDSIREATPQITKITSRLKRDFDEVLIPQRRTGLEGSISTMTGYYEAERIKPGSTRKDRKAILSEINSLTRSFELFVASSPAEMVQGMEDANQALFAYANSGRKNADFVQLVARIGEFRDRAKEVSETVKEIREIRRKLRDEN